MTMKKLAAMLMALTMSVAMLASCGGDDSSSKAESTPDSSVADSSVADSVEDSSVPDSSDAPASSEEPSSEEPAAPAGPVTFSAFDESKILYGDIEHGGKFRIELFNTYGDTKNDPAFDNEEIDFTGGLSVTFDIAGMTNQEKEYLATMTFADAGWQWQSWGINDNNVGAAKIVGDGTYTVYLTKEICSSANPNYANGKTDDEAYPGYGWGAAVFCIDIYELAVDEALTGKDEATGEFSKGNITISNVKVEWWEEGYTPDYVKPVDSAMEKVDEDAFAKFEATAE